MSDELDPVTEKFIADLSGYIEPIQDAADDTEEFATTVEEAKEALSGLRDDAAEAGAGIGDLAGHAAEAGAGLDELGGSADAADGSLDGLAATADDADASTETLAEAFARARDAVYEMYPGIDEATASLPTPIMALFSSTGSTVCTR
jgi:methyl-accepting chemotaxis protein